MSHPTTNQAHDLRKSIAILTVAIAAAITAPTCLASAPAPVPLPFPPTPRTAGDGSCGSASAETSEPSYTAISNIMKAKHDTVKNSISNVR
jgi:hypothetical protein